MADRKVRIFFDESNMLRVDPEELQVSGGDRVTFQFDTDATVNLVGDRESDAQMFADLQEFSKRRGESQTIEIKNIGEAESSVSGIPYKVSANIPQTTTQASTAPKMILE